MILSYTEQEKKIIEKSGLQVIEYKRLQYDAIKRSEEVKRIMQNIKDAVQKVCEMFSEIGAWIYYTLEDLMISVRKSIQKRYRAHSVKKILKYNKCNKPYKGARRIDIRCRSRC